MRIREDFTVGRPAAEVWGLIEEGAALECVPGLICTGDGRGSLQIDLGADHLVFDGEAAAHLDPVDRTARVEARAIERHGQGRLRLLLGLSVEDDGLFSAVQVESDLALAGELVDLGKAGRLAEASHWLAVGFADRLEAALAAPGSAAGRPGRIEAGDSGQAERPPAGLLARLLGRLGRS